MNNLPKIFCLTLKDTPKRKEYAEQHFTVLNPVEQYLIQKKKRLFKGIEDYNEVHRMVFDIETTGLEPEKNNIILITIMVPILY